VVLLVASGSAERAQVLGGQQGDGWVVGPHALWPVAPEVDQHGLLAVADHQGELVPVRSAGRAPPDPDPVAVGEVDVAADRPLRRRTARGLRRLADRLEPFPSLSAGTR
jgi:hypothetical protein